VAWSIFNFVLLFASAMTISLVSHYFLPAYRPPWIQAPQTADAWLVMIFGSFAVAYLEEIYFRFYLLHRLDIAGFKPLVGNFISILLFRCATSMKAPWEP